MQSPIRKQSSCSAEVYTICYTVPQLVYSIRHDLRPALVAQQGPCWSETMRASLVSTRVFTLIARGADGRPDGRCVGAGGGCCRPCRSTGTESGGLARDCDR